MAVSIDKPLEPRDSGLLVAVFDAAACLQDLVGAHRRVTDEDQSPVGTILVQDVEGGDALVASAGVVAPDMIVDAVVEIEVLEVAEFALGRGEQFLADRDVRIHRATDVEKEQY